MMEKEDARYQVLEKPHEWRKQVMKLNNNGIKIMQIMGMTGLSYLTGRDVAKQTRTHFNGLIKQDSSKDRFIMSSEVHMSNQNKHTRSQYASEEYRGHLGLMKMQKVWVERGIIGTMRR
jgi:hypothetical protein